MRILYLIPARKGSKGLPHKNTKILGEKPLIEYSIDFALQNMNSEDELCISTNDSKVIKIAESKGINIPFIRPKALSNDNATSYDVIKHALNYYTNNNNKFDVILLLQPTSPFRDRQDLIGLINQFDSNTDMVASVSLAKENPYFTLFEEDSKGFLYKSKKGNFEKRQDCPKVYKLNGSMYLIKIESIKKYRIDEFKNVKKIIMPNERSVDIDTIEDWILAEHFLKTKIH